MYSTVCVRAERHEVEVEVRDGGEPERRNTFTLALQLVGERFLVPSSGASDGGILSRLVGQGPLADWLASERCAYGYCTFGASGVRVHSVTRINSRINKTLHLAM